MLRTITEVVFLCAQCLLTSSAEYWMRFNCSTHELYARTTATKSSHLEMSQSIPLPFITHVEKLKTTFRDIESGYSMRAINLYHIKQHSKNNQVVHNILSKSCTYKLCCIWCILSKRLWTVFCWLCSAISKCHMNIVSQVSPTCSRLSSSANAPVSPLLLIGISIVAALLITLSVIMHSVCKIKRQSFNWLLSIERPNRSLEEDRPQNLVKTAKSMKQMGI